MGKEKSTKVIKQGGMGGIYFLCMIGSAVYFLQTSYGFWGSVLALLKAIVWPAFLTHQLFINLGV